MRDSIYPAELSGLKPADAGLVSCVTVPEFCFMNFTLKTRLAKALEAGSMLYSTYREHRVAARIDLDALFDQIGLSTGWVAHRLDARTLMLDAPGLFIECKGSRKASYCSCFFKVWAETPARAEDTIAAIIGCIGITRIDEPMFSIRWHFRSGKDIHSVEMEEMADNPLLDEAYPSIEHGVLPFITRYLDARETVLVLQGPPGTGKTRLIRAILAEMSRRKGSSASAIYTGDMRVFESDELFVKFIVGSDDGFLVEDADHLLKPRSDGNLDMHRFLAIADGIVRSQGRKIIFSTNLPNVGDLDDALIRPGRCFARVFVRELMQSEAERLINKLCDGDEARVAQALCYLDGTSRKTFSLASIYAAVDQAAVKVELER